MKYGGVRIAEFDNFMLSQDSHTHWYIEILTMRGILYTLRY